MIPQPGDIIVYLVEPSDGLSSLLVAFGEIILAIFFKKDRHVVKQSSHWALWTSPGRQIEAVWPRVRRSGIYNRAYEIWRRVGITEKERKDVLASAHRKIGQRYGILYVMSFGLIKVKGYPVCCTLVQDCYADAGMFVKGAEPDDIYTDKSMTMIYTNRKQ